MYFFYDVLTIMIIEEEEECNPFMNDTVTQIKIINKNHSDSLSRL